MEASDAKEITQRHQYLKGKEAIVEDAIHTVASVDFTPTQQENDFEIYVNFNEVHKYTPDRVTLDEFFNLPDVLEFYYGMKSQPGNEGWKVGASNSRTLLRTTAFKAFQYDSIEKAIYHFNHFKIDKNFEAHTDEPSNDETFVYIFKN